MKIMINIKKCLKWLNLGLLLKLMIIIKSEGFTYYCGVDLTTIPWVQLSTSASYLRQGRVTLNGTQLTRYPERLAPFFDAAAVLDKTRP